MRAEQHAQAGAGGGGSEGLVQQTLLERHAADGVTVEGIGAHDEQLFGHGWATSTKAFEPATPGPHGSPPTVAFAANDTWVVAIAGRTAHPF